jgi:phenol/toluene 2-monooxygenase (NADH) P0/A0
MNPLNRVPHCNIAVIPLWSARHECESVLARILRPFLFRPRGTRMSDQGGFNPGNKYVRVTELRADGFVEFEFAIGEPELFCEMILPAAVFDDFCQINRVIFLDPGARPGRDPGAGEEQEEWNWTLRDATHLRTKAG